MKQEQTQDNIKECSLVYQTITVLSEKIRSGEVSPAAIVEQCLSRIDTLNPKLNAFITVLADEARAEAKVAESEIKAGNWKGPLHGIPVALKDFYDMKGVRTTGGFKHMKNRIADSDATVVTKLKEVGAIIVGKTNMDSLGMATTGLTSYFGPVHNPWNEEYIPGGSSAGSAVAVATGMCYATVDTDAVGSVRLPAAFCGVVGFKGSYDLMSGKGILGDGPVDDFIRAMAHVALTTRSASDIALLLDVLAENNPKHFAQDVASAVSAKNIKIGICSNFHADEEVTRVFNNAVEVIKNLGYPVESVSAPLFNPFQNGIGNIKNDREAISSNSFSDVDVMVLPTIQAIAPSVKVAEKNAQESVSVDATVFANYYGLPAISVPCGFDSHSVPIGLQFVSKPQSESVALAVAGAYELAFKMFGAHPVLN